MSAANPGNAHIYIATGDSGEGLTTGVVAGMLLRDLILKRENAWADAYAPQRVTAGAAGAYIRENVTTVTSLTGYVTGGEVSSAEDLEPGQGAIVRHGMQKVAAYRTRTGDFTSAQPHVHMPTASCSGTRWKNAGIALATAPIIRSTGGRSMAPRSIRSPRLGLRISHPDQRRGRDALRD
jgi:hypothetical protein